MNVETCLRAFEAVRNKNVSTEQVAAAIGIPRRSAVDVVQQLLGAGQLARTDSGHLEIPQCRWPGCTDEVAPLLHLCPTHRDEYSRRAGKPASIEISRAQYRALAEGRTLQEPPCPATVAANLPAAVAETAAPTESAPAPEAALTMPETTMSPGGGIWTGGRTPGNPISPVSEPAPRAPDPDRAETLAAATAAEFKRLSQEVARLQAEAARPSPWEQFARQVARAMAPAEVGDLAERHLQPTDLLELLEDVMAAREQALQARAQWLDKGPGLEGPGLEVLALGSHDGEPSITLVGDPQSIRSCAALLYRRVRLVPAAQVAEALVRANVEGK